MIGLRAALLVLLGLMGGPLAAQDKPLEALETEIGRAHV